MTKFLLSAFGFLSFLSFGYALPVITDPTGEKDITIKGKIIDKETNLPLEYATISFFSKRENKVVDGCITDANGEFNINIINYECS